MGLTQLEASKSIREPDRLFVVRELADDPLMGIMPFQDIEGGGVDYAVEGEYPAVFFRGLNEAVDPSYGVINPQYERLRMMQGVVNVDQFILDTQGEEPKARQVAMQARALRFKFIDNFIKGDSDAGDPRVFDGLRKRINVGSSQAINAGTAALSLGLLDELIDQVDASGGQKVIIMNKKMRRRLTAASRATGVGGFITYTQDQMGRRLEMYGDIPIIATDTNAENQQIIGFDEASSTTSIYCVAFGDQLTTGIQGRCRGTFGPSVEQLGSVQDAAVDRTRLDWYCSVAIYNGRSAARIYGVTDAAVTS
jgi:hypothetical protein